MRRSAGATARPSTICPSTAATGRSGAKSAVQGCANPPNPACNKSAQRLPARVSLKPPKPAGGTGSRRSYPSAAQRKQTHRRPPYGGSFFSYSPRANGRKKEIPPPKPKKNLRAGLKRHKRASPPAQKISAHNGETPRIPNGAGVFRPKSARADSATRKRCMPSAATSRAADHLRKIRLSLRKRKRAGIAVHAAASPQSLWELM